MQRGGAAPAGQIQFVAEVAGGEGGNRFGAICGVGNGAGFVTAAADVLSMAIAGTKPEEVDFEEVEEVVVGAGGAQFALDAWAGAVLSPTDVGTSALAGSSRYWFVVEGCDGCGSPGMSPLVSHGTPAGSCGISPQPTTGARFEA
jgi:hypothetical protein